MMLRQCVLVVCGGVAGTFVRALLGVLWGAGYGVGVTLGINLVGSFLLAVVYGVTTTPWLRLFFGTGFMGGFTTYSAFAVDSLGLLEANLVMALGYILASVIGGVVLALAGSALGRRLRGAS